jgi:transcriptional regulator with XRE-family HTH domain
MTQAGPTQEVARRVKELRGKRGLSAAALAKRMTELGVKWDRSIVANLEGGRRQTVSVAELLALALALNVAPVHLLVPIDGPDEPYWVTPGLTYRRDGVRAWIRGVTSIDQDADWREFFAEVPKDEFYSVQGTPERRRPMLQPEERYPEDAGDEPR